MAMATDPAAVPFPAEAAAVDAAAEDSVALIRRFAAMDPRDRDRNAWADPDRILAELRAARARLAAAWDALQDRVEAARAADAAARRPRLPEEDLRAAYVDMVTDAFADVLEEMRQREEDEGAEQLDIEVLADCLQSGLDLMTQEDRDLFAETLALGMDDAVEGSGAEPRLTPHERRRRELGFNVEA